MNHMTAWLSLATDFLLSGIAYHCVHASTRNASILKPLGISSETSSPISSSLIVHQCNTGMLLQTLIIHPPPMATHCSTPDQACCECATASWLYRSTALSRPMDMLLCYYITLHTHLPSKSSICTVLRATPGSPRQPYGTHPYTCPQAPAGWHKAPGPAQLIMLQ